MITSIINYISRKLRVKNLIAKIKNLARNISLSIKIIKAFKNWPYYFLAYLRFFKGREIEYHLRNGVRLLVPVDTYSRSPMTEIWIFQNYTPPGLEINKKDTVVDIGAHIGNFSIYAARLAKQGKIYAYEPALDNFRLLNHNIRLNQLDNIVTFDSIVSACKGKKRIYLTDSSSTSSVFGDRGQKFHLAETIGLKDILQENNLEKIDFLKIDCEGSEYDILLNTPRKYLDKIDKIALEYHEGEFTKHKCKDLKVFLQKNGFMVKKKPVALIKDLRLGMLYAWRK